MAILNVLYLVFINPDINTSMPLSQVSSIVKMLLPALVIFAMALGSFFRHSYYSKSFKISFWSLQSLAILLMLWYVRSIQAQHL